MLKGKTAVITGASRGLGKAIALEMASRGVNIAAVCASSKEKAESLCKECESRFHIKAKTFICNVADAAQAEKTAKAVIEEFGSAQILVNNAGITRDMLAIAMKEEDYDIVLDVNLKGAFLMAKNFLPFFLKERNGVIINMSSISGIMGNAGQSNYAASKAGLIGLTKALAREYAKKGIRCNAIAPGFIKTEMTEDLDAREIEKMIPLGRMGNPEEVAEAAAFLADAEYMTGAVLQIDGGFAM